MYQSPRSISSPESVNCQHQKLESTGGSCAVTSMSGCMVGPGKARDLRVTAWLISRGTQRSLSLTVRRYSHEWWHDPTRERRSRTCLHRHTAIPFYPYDQVRANASRSGSGRCANMPIPDEASKGCDTVRSSHHGQAVRDRRCVCRVREWR